MRGQVLRDDEPAGGWAGLSLARRVQLFVYAAGTVAALGLAVASYAARAGEPIERDWILKANPGGLA